jgi:uncharacterized protein (TIGR02996 family)
LASLQESPVNDGELLRRTILAQPHEDTPRLAFADWCEESGRPQRAQLIRLQCERESLPSWDARAIEIDEQLTAMGFDLWDEHRNHANLFKMVLADLPEETDRKKLELIWLQSSSGEITNFNRISRLRRGFAEYFRCEDKQAEQLEQLPTLTPVTAIRLRGRVGASVETISRLPRQLSRLEVAPYWPEEADFRGLLRLDLPSLTHLSLEPPYTWNAARVDALASDLWSLFERRWDSLALVFHLSNSTLERLRNCCGQVRELTLGAISGDGYDRLFGGSWTAKVERLRLWQYEDNHRIPAAGLNRLMTAIGGLPNLRLLDLGRFKFTATACKAFVNAGGLNRVEELTVNRNNKLGFAWLQQVAKGDQPTSLRRLNVYDCGFSDEHMKWLVRGSHPHLVWLDLAHIHSPGEGVTAAGITALADSPLRGQLRLLNFNNHPFGNDGLRALTMHEWPELQVLDIRWNAEQDAVADFLFRGRFPRMVRVEIGCAGASDRLARAIADAPAAEPPYTLHLGTRLTDDDIPGLLRSRYLHSLRRFWLIFSGGFSDAGKQRLRDHFGERINPMF